MTAKVTCHEFQETGPACQMAGAGGVTEIPRKDLHQSTEVGVLESSPEGAAALKDLWEVPRHLILQPWEQVVSRLSGELLGSLPAPMSPGFSPTSLPGAALFLPRSPVSISSSRRLAWECVLFRAIPASLLHSFQIVPTSGVALREFTFLSYWWEGEAGLQVHVKLSQGA